jgi:hypothetical protein
MGLVNAAGFPAPGKPEKKAKKSKKAEPIPTLKEMVDSIEECCALGCNDCHLEQPAEEQK